MTVVRNAGRKRGLTRAAALLIVAPLALASCGLLFGGGGNPRPDDPNTVRPVAPTDAAKWASLTWQDGSFERPPHDSAEQWDRPAAVAAGPGGFVAVGSNDDVMGYVGRIWRSDDALDWRLVDVPVLDGLGLEDIAANNSGYVAIGTRSANPNAPTASLLTSPDGRSWTEAESVTGAWATRIVEGAGGFAVVVQVDDGSDLLLSPDGVDWTRVRGADIGAGAFVADLAWDNGWIAVGSVGDRAALWRSADGKTWTEEELPSSTPVDGVLDVSAYRVIPGRWATIVLGLDRAPACAQDEDFCSKYQVAWSRAVGGEWMRLPKSTWILERGYGIDLYAAGDAGFLYLLGKDARLSPDGWDWAAVSATGASDALTGDVVVSGNRVIAVGVPGGPDLTGWFGAATINR